MWFRLTQRTFLDVGKRVVTSQFPTIMIYLYLIFIIIFWELAEGIMPNKRISQGAKLNNNFEYRLIIEYLIQEMSIDLQWILHTVRRSPKPQSHSQTSPQPCYTGFAPQTAQLGNCSETDKWPGFHQSKLCLRPGSTEMLPYRAERRGHRSLRFVLAGKLGWGNRQRRE